MCWAKNIIQRAGIEVPLWLFVRLLM